MRWAVATLFALTLCAAAAAAVEAPLVRAELEPEKVMVGETAKLRVTVLVPTFFKGPPVYPSFEIADAMTRLPPDSSYPTTEDIDGEAWSGIVRDYEIVPLVAGRFALDPGTVVVRFADPDGGETRDAERPVPRFALRAVVPTGAESLEPYVGGSSLQLERTLEGEADGLEVGDALVVRVRARLRGMASVFLPPLVGEPSEAGLRAYAKQPVFSDDDGEAVREESVTYVFESAGRHIVPGVRLDWWNTASKQVEVAELQPMEVAVARGSQATAGTLGWRWLLLAVAALAAGYALVRRGRPILAALRTRWLESELRAYRRLRAALRRRKPVASYRSLMAWLAVCAPGYDTTDLVEELGDAELAAMLERLKGALYGAGQAEVDYAVLRARLALARRRLRRRRSPHAAPDLPALNPPA